MRKYIFALIASLAINHATVYSQSSEDYPNRPITLVVPFTPGGVTDITTRLIGQKLGEVLNQAVVIDNRPGSGGNIAAAYVARSPANGYTLFLATIGTHAINQNLYQTMPYDSEKDFAPLSRLAVFPNFIVAVLGSTDVQEKLSALGAEAAPQSPAEFAVYMKEESNRWRRVINDAKISIN